MNPPHWTAYIAVVVLPTIALIGAWIAFRQSQIARNKLKLDLFERRMAVYETVRETLGAVTRSGKLTQAEEISYLSGTRAARWLFGSEVSKYFDETLWHKIVDLGLHNSMSSTPAGVERAKHIAARAETMKWIMDQYAELDKICEPYLSLRH